MKNETLARNVLYLFHHQLAALALEYFAGEVISGLSWSWCSGIGVAPNSSIFISAPTLMYLQIGGRTSLVFRLKQRCLGRFRKAGSLGKAFSTKVPRMIVEPQASGFTHFFLAKLGLSRDYINRPEHGFRIKRSCSASVHSICSTFTFHVKCLFPDRQRKADKSAARFLRPHAVFSMHINAESHSR